MEYIEGDCRVMVYKNEHGEKHRVDGPAYQKWNAAGSLVEQEWYQNGKLHRLDGPAMMGFHDTGRISYEAWRVNNKTHRVDGPSYRQWNIDGLLILEEWCQEDMFHRENGPAIIDYNGGVPYQRIWVIRDKALSKKEIKALRRPISHKLAFNCLPIPIRDAIWKQFLAFFAPIYCKQ